MSTMAGRSMIERMKGAALLDVPTFEEVEHDTTATGQAAGVVGLVAVASAIGAIGHGGLAIGFGIVWAFVGWLIWSGLCYFIGTNLFEGQATWGEVLRTVGFAQAPGVLNIVGFIPLLGGLVRLAVFFWLLAAVVVALRQALDISTGKAVVTGVIGWLVMVVPMMLLGAMGAFLAH
jgi:hypothetical protein